MKRALLDRLKWVPIFGLLTASWSAMAEDAGPRRIVALSPALAELAAEFLGEAESSRLVGVTDYSDTPEWVRRVPSVGSYARFNLEKVVALKPDLVLATSDGNARDQIERLRSLGKKVLLVQTRNLDEVMRSFEQIAQALGRAEQGRARAAQFNQEFAALRGRVSQGGALGRTIALQLGDDPLVFVGGSTFTGDLLQKLGFHLVFGDASQPYPRPSREHLLAHPPDEIWILALGGDPKTFEKMKDRWVRFRFITKQRPLIKVLAADDWVRPTGRLLRAARAAVDEALAGVPSGGQP